MASPFRYFRKHTKAFYAVAAVLAIFIFVFASGTGGGSSRDDQPRRPAATVATWNGGSINEAQLDMLARQRLLTNDFLQRLFIQGGGRSEYDLPRTVPMFLLPGNISRPALELQVINTEVFSSLAEQAGLSVSDGMINHYLKEFGLNRVNSDDIIGLLTAAGGGKAGSTEAIVFDTLRKLLLAYFYHGAYEDAARTILPEQRWADWRNVNERITLQAAILPVEKFLADVPEPTDAQLQAFYARYKVADPDRYEDIGGPEPLPSPEPGFAVPRRVTLQYLLGSVADRTEKLLPTITDAEIADYYERNKRTEFVKTSLDVPDDFGNDLPLDEPAAEGPATDEPAEPAAETAAPPSTGEAAPAEPAATEPTASEADGDSPVADAPAGDDATATPAAETTEPRPADVPAAEPAPGEASGEGSAPSPEEQSTRERRSPFQLTALQAATDDTAAEAAAETATPDETATPAETVADEAADAPADVATPESADARADDASPADAAVPAAEGEAAPATAGAATTAPAAASDTDPAAPAADGATDEYLPLEEVRDEIRDRIARTKATDELQRQLSEARLKLQGEYNTYGRKVIVNREADKPAPPVPDKLKSLQWLADQYGLEVVTTEPLTGRELSETAVGAATDEQSGRVSVTNAAFLTLEPYEPLLAKDLDGDRFLVLKTADTPQSIPPFSEVRDQVAAAWKHAEAAKLAEAKAKELAKASETATEPFADYFKAQGYDVVPQTGLFSWRYFPLDPSLGYPPLVSEVPELAKVDNAFMQAAFDLEGNETAAVLNHDHSAAYVIRLHSPQYPPDTLKKMFLEEIGAWAGFRPMLSERYSVMRQSVDNKLAADLAGFKFDEEWEQRRVEEIQNDRQ